MKRLIYLLLLLPISLFGQDQWNNCGTSVRVYPQPSYDSTFVLSAPNREAIGKGMAEWTAASSGASYKEYVALVSQIGTSAPTATILVNTLGFTPVWSYENPGVYQLTYEGGFPFGKTLGFSGGVSDDAIYGGWTKFIEGGSNWWTLQVFDADGVPSDDGLVNSSIMIRVYP